eukprot:CAMPEP_0181336532 /NCGR_PEP_ID=MMETSP1101-20121128/27478_1 /TAXON_ID=46948 /ORGANISM="Rhodomonas abbreviata, Strain Caron Lab Isolate" /LENGTH=187 /DNA_ID=CAMNT_0023446851 /DNA_START=168 /DNA_END=728 /DNA_ORIENTATION=-
MKEKKDKTMVTKSGYKHIHSFKGHKDVVNCFVYNDENLYTASNDQESLINCWSLTPEDLQKEGSNHKPIRTFGANKSGKYWHEQGVCCLALSGQYLYSGSFDSQVIKWNADTGEALGMYSGHGEAVYSVACLDVWLLTASRDKTVRVWNESSQKTSAILRGHEAPIRAMVLADRLLYTGSDDYTIHQ